MNKQNMITLTLDQIASREFDCGKIVIPPVQRGLVWNAVRAEVLWDSILRGLPIGTFSLHESKAGEYELLDGQQRSNAIAMGFSFAELQNLTPKAIARVKDAVYFGTVDGLNEFALKPLLWLDIGKVEVSSGEDLNADEEGCSNRKYGFKVTTAAHPWGYGDGESETSNDVLPLELRTDSMSTVYRECGKWRLGERPLPCEVWPLNATLPVPMAIVVEFVKNSDEGSRNIECFCGWCEKTDGVKDANWFVINRFSDKAVKFGSNWDIVVSCIEKRLKETGVAAIVADVDSRDIGLYFSRMNKSGIEPTAEDIQYSLLKDSLKDVVLGREVWNRMDEYASRFGVKSSRLVSIAMRFVLNCDRDSTEYLTGELPVSKFLLNRKRFAEFVGADGLAIGGRGVNLFDLLDKIQKDFCGDLSILSWLLSELVANDDGVALLWLMRIESAPQMVLPDGLTILGLMTYVAWFSTDLASVVRLVWRYNGDIKSALYRALRGNDGNEILSFPLSREEMKQFVSTADNAEDGFSSFIDRIRSAWLDDSMKSRLDNFWCGFAGNGQHGDFLHAHGSSILLFACRNYLQKVFKACIPGQPQWMEQNRPWDIDHLIPKSWLESVKKDEDYDKQYYPVFASLLWSIGNAVPIPYQINRSKSAKPADEYYPYRESEVPDWCAATDGKVSCEKSGLHLNAEIVMLGGRSELSDNANWFEVHASRHQDIHDFCKFTIERIASIYNDWYDNCGIDSVLNVMDSDAAKNDHRNQFLEAALEKCEELGMNCGLWYVVGNKEFPVLREIDKAHAWVTLGIKSKKSMVALTSYDYEGLDWETGVRKAPECISVDTEFGASLPKLCDDAGVLLDWSYANSGWWYYYLSTKYRKGANFSIERGMERHFEWFLRVCEAAKKIELIEVNDK